MANSEIEPEIIVGAENIARLLGVTKRTAFYMLARGQIAGSGKIGNQWCLSLPTFRRAMHGNATEAA